MAGYQQGSRAHVADKAATWLAWRSVLGDLETTKEVQLDDKVTVAKITDDMSSRIDREFWDACRLALAENTMVPGPRMVKKVDQAWTDTELLAIEQLAKEQDLTPFQVLRQAMRCYQEHKIRLKQDADKALMEDVLRTESLRGDDATDFSEPS